MNTEKELKAIQKIDEILMDFRESFISPIIKLPKKKNGEEVDPVKLLKRVNGIIKGFTEENAKRKVDSLIKFFEGIRNRTSK